MSNTDATFYAKLLKYEIKFVVKIVISLHARYFALCGIEDGM